MPSLRRCITVRSHMARNTSGTRGGAIARARAFVESGTFEAELARRVGSPAAVRAVASACAANPVAVAIPCHRVVRNDGGLSGYRWGIERKAALIEREQE